MIHGKVKLYNRDRGFGFIGRDDGGPDAFVHISELQRAGLDGIEIGQRLSFDVETQRDGRLRAIEVSVAK